MKTIPFFTGDITLNVHSASKAEFVGKQVTIDEFANGVPVGLYETEDKELLCRKRGGEFIEGAEV